MTIKGAFLEERGGGFLNCCVDTILEYARKVDCELPAEGFSMPCNHCSADLIWSRGAWEAVSLPAIQIRHAASAAKDVQRFERGQKITEGRMAGAMTELAETAPFVPPSTVWCEHCPFRAGFLELRADGVAAYACNNGHTTIKDYSKEMGLR